MKWTFKVTPEFCGLYFCLRSFLQRLQPGSLNTLAGVWMQSNYYIYFWDTLNKQVSSQGFRDDGAYKYRSKRERIKRGWSGWMLFCFFPLRVCFLWSSWMLHMGTRSRANMRSTHRSELRRALSSLPVLRRRVWSTSSCACHCFLVQPVIFIWESFCWNSAPALVLLLFLFLSTDGGKRGSQVQSQAHCLSGPLRWNVGGWGQTDVAANEQNHKSLHVDSIRHVWFDNWNMKNVNRVAS